MNINLSQFFPSGIPVGMAISMPALAAAGTATFTTTSNELYVNNATATMTPQSSCNSALPAAVGATNDVAFSAAQTSLVGFQNISNCLAGNWGTTQSAPNSQSTKAFYVGGVYYFFGPSSTTVPTLSWTSTTDLVNFTPAVTITPCSFYTIVDIAYNNGAWVFLDSTGTIITMTDLTLFTNTTINVMPLLVAANGYRNITNINGIWYVIGASSAGAGCRISSSTNLVNWTVVIDNNTTGMAVSICQGAGTGAATEILVGCASDTILKSTNNGTSFAVVTPVTGFGASTIIKHVFYSARTGKYYLAVSNNNTTAEQMYVAVSSTGTLATANFTTTYYVGLGYTGSFNGSAMQMVDNGTNVGLCASYGSGGHYFYYGASFNTLSSAILTPAQLQGYSGAINFAKSYWLNNTLITICGGGNAPPMLVTSNGATCASNVAIVLCFPVATYVYTGGLNIQWSGLTYLNGAYYAVNGIPYYYSPLGVYYYYWAFMYKLNAALTLMSCPVAPVTAYGGGSSNGMVYTTTYGISSGRIGAGGTSINWAGYNTQNYNSSVYNPIFTFNGTTFVVNGVNSPNANGGYQSTLAVAGVPSSCLALPKWSSLLNTYVMALPMQTYDVNSNYPALVVTSATLNGNPASTLVNAGIDTRTSDIDALDVLSNGMVVALTSYYVPNGGYPFTSYTLTINNGTQNYSVWGGQTIGNFGLWEIDYGGYTYLVFAFTAGYQGTSSALYVWRLSTTGAPVAVVNNYPITMTITGGTTLCRVFNYNGSFYLGDAAGVPASSRNAFMLTPSAGSFNINVAELYVPGDNWPTGAANTYSNTNGVTVVNPAGIPSVFLPSNLGYFTKVR